MNTKQIQQNIRSVYALTFFSGLYFDRALWMLYLVERGLNLAQAGLLESLLHLAIVVFEVPTGMIADLYGRKKSLLIGSVIALSYSLFMWVGDGFYTFSLAFALFGLANTFRSGAQQALIYDTLAAGGEESRYTKVMGNETALILLSLSLAQWSGGLMAGQSWELVYGATFVMQVLALVPVLLIREPQRPLQEQPPEKRSMWQVWRTQFVSALSIWKSQPAVRRPILLYLTLSTVITVVIFYAQEHFSRQGFSTGEIGFIFMVEGLLGAVAAKVAHRIESRFASTRIFYGIYALFVVFLVVFALITGVLAVGALFFLSMLTVTLDPIFSSFIQNKLTSDIRSTFFSMISLCTSLGIMIVFPAFGAVVDKIGFQNAFLGLVALLLLIGLSGVVKKSPAVKEQKDVEKV